MEGNYWQGKTACWDILGCSPLVYHHCPTYRYPERPCWETPYTQCEIMMNFPKDCSHCKVYKLYWKKDG